MWDLIDQSIENAVDTNLNLIITGDFNDNQKTQASSNMRDILTNYNLKQLIDKPTSFSEHSSTLIDLFVTGSLEVAVTYFMTPKVMVTFVVGLT